MDSETIIRLGVLLLAAGSVGAIAYAIAYPYLSGERGAAKRIASVVKGKSARGSRTAQKGDELAARRKQVQENLKELEKKQKARTKVTLRGRIAQSGLDITVKKFYIASAILAAFALVVALVGGTHPAVAALIAFAAGLGVPRWVLRFLAKRRLNKFIDEFANAIDVIVRGVKTGLPLNECLDIISRESPEPIKSEFSELVEQQRIGVPLMDCFERMMERVPVAEVNFFATVIAIQQQAGGNLAEALSNLSGVLRSRKMLAAKVKALSAEAKASAVILAALPFTVMIMVYLSSPEYISLLWTETRGKMMLAGAGFWMTCGLLVMRKMINFKY